MYFVNTNFPEDRVQALLPWKNISELPDDSQIIFKRSNIDRYMEKQSATFYNEKYSVLNDFCYVESWTYYTLENKSNKTCEYQPVELNDNLIENIYEECSYPLKIKLMISDMQFDVEK